jgi:hypothetical protein
VEQTFMRKSRLLAAGLAFASALSVGQARASSVTFGDSVRYWDGYQNGTSDDSRDTIGHPDLTGGTATFSAEHLLTSVQIDYLGPFSLSASGRGSVIPGDLFIDAGADGDWDYVLKAVTRPYTAASYTSLSILDVGGEVVSYLMSGSDNSGHWLGYLIRNNHPYAWNGGGEEIGTGSLAADGLLTGGAHSLLFDLGSGLDVGAHFTIGFAASCGNDVIFERMTAPTPEPGAALVFFAALLLATRGPLRVRA